MKRPTIFRRLLLPALAFLLLLPPISCLVFRESAERYAYAEANRELQALQERIGSIARETFSDGDEIASNDPIRAFLGKAGPVASQTGGNARLMLLAGQMQVIYPRDAELREAVAPLAAEFTRAIEDGSAFTSNEFVSEGGETYLLNVTETPVSSPRIRYIITYCPASQIGGWIGNATHLVLAISAVFALLAFAALWAAAKSVTAPLRRLCAEAERIGDGDFAPIEPAFSLSEPEELRGAMNEMSVRLQRADEVQKAFFQNVSHELRNPLMSISGYAQGIEQGVFPNAKGAAHTILEESTRLTEVVGGLLTLSRLESGEMAVELSPIRLAETIEDCFDRVNGLAMQKGVTLRMDAQEPELAALGAEELLDKALDNLLTNAIRYAKTTVTVSTKSEVDKVILAVADDGDGIDETDLPHIFERCYKGRGGNFGIGLALAKTAAERMGGTLTAANQPQGGAVFTLILIKEEPDHETK